MGKNLGWCIFLIILLGACQERTEEPLDLGMDYFPVQTGSFWIYEVEETLYFGEHDQESGIFFFRDEIMSSYTDGTGDMVHVMLRKKSTDQEDWQNELVFTYRVTENAVLRTMNNITDVPIVFPPSPFISWDSNLYNHLPEDFYEIISIGTYSLGNRQFENTVKVLQEEDDDQIISRDLRYEIFAKGVGMIESYYEVLTYCSRNDCLGEQIVDTGRFTHLKLKSNG